ncbi:hypothetical protein [Thermosulfurimonas sp. F29]|uniref:hypothetical protein n=1 Tax=Thermosulfurimonas sp. F29 TaxID=2867247 RepID=UPI001C835CAC|nr:hypothetical protein [Thermosulfurimonas sp. F29]MBX6422635.1 hypothetical protein [Thermosulfurimonas sp. F29]
MPKDIKFLNESKFEELQKLIEKLLEEANKCASVQAYLAGCIVLGSALEAMLLAMVDVFPEEVQKALKNLPNIKYTDPRYWSLSDLLQIAFKIGWIPFKDIDDPDQGDLGDWLLNYVKELRNLVHPGKKIRDYKDICLTREHFKTARDLIDITIKYLLSKVEKALAKDLGLDMEETTRPKAPANFPKAGDE